MHKVSVDTLGELPVLLKEMVAAASLDSGLLG